jgi:hypothetical protein
MVNKDFWSGKELPKEVELKMSQICNSTSNQCWTSATNKGWFSQWELMLTSDSHLNENHFENNHQGYHLAPMLCEYQDSSVRIDGFGFNIKNLTWPNPNIKNY